MVSNIQKDVKSSSAFDRHGQIRCGTLSVSDLDISLALYEKYLRLDLVERGQVSAELASCWGAEKVVGAPFAVLQPQSGSQSFLRLIEASEPESYTPAKSLGWNAFEISVKDVFSLADDLENSEFEVVGPPKLVDGFTSFIPMQVFGPDGEVLFLNQVNHSDDDTDLPLAESTVDEIFIVVVASPDSRKSAEEHVQFLNLDEAATHSLRYSLINRAFDLPMSTLQTITMVQKGRMPFSQIDQYPSNAEIRPRQPGHLPMGNAMVSVMVESIEELPIQDKTLGPVTRPDGEIYQGRKTQVIQGTASELIELIEL